MAWAASFVHLRADRRAELPMITVPPPAAPPSAPRPAPASAAPGMARWLAIPALFVLVGLITLAMSSQLPSLSGDNGSVGGSNPTGGEPGSGQSMGGNGSSSGGRTGSGGDDQVVGGGTGRSRESGSEEPTADGNDLTVTSPDGEVIIDVEGDTPTNPNRPGGVLQPVQPDETGDVAGLRRTEGGELVPVGPDELRPTDYRLDTVPGGGIDLTRPDGTRFEFRPGTDGRFDITEVSPDGQRTEVQPDPSGQVEIDTDTYLQVAPPSLWEQASGTPWPWIALGITLIALASIALAWYMHHIRPRERPGLDLGLDLEPAAPIPIDQFEAFLSRLAADPDPGRAIRLAFRAAERGLGGIPSRRAEETPLEWYDRVQASRPDTTEPLSGLCARFTTVKFAPGEATLEDRDEAIMDLRRLHALTPASPASGVLQGVG
ncbi:MAG: hypothetical protein ACK5PP_11460 [Acidimicrobiales bacterium]